MIKYDLKFLFERHASEKSVDGLAASNAILIVVAPAVGAGKKMLYASLCLRQRLLTEEAKATLYEHETVEWLRGH